MKYLSNIASYVNEKIEINELDNKTYISTENMLPNKAGITDATTLPNMNLTSAFKTGDVLVSNIRPYFKKIWQATFDGGCSNDVLVFRAKDGTDSKYLYYVLSNDKFFDYSMSTSKGTKMPRGDKKSLMEYSVPDINKETQRKIAKVLGVIDDKIELNNSINKNLEQQAQAIFKSWFIDFEPFDGTMPDEWEYVELGELGLDISDGNYSSKYPKTNEFVPKGIAFIRGTDFVGTSISQDNMYYITEEKHKELLKGHTKKDDILITTRGDIGRIAFVPDSLIDKNINSQLVRINGADIFPKSYLACSLLSDNVQNDFKSLITGSALQQLPVGRLKKILLLKPTKEVLNKFDNICKPLFNMSFINYEENNRLTKLRDTLLPKLMNGEIDVDKVEV